MRANLHFFSSKENRRKALIVLVILVMAVVAITIATKPIYPFFKDASRISKFLRSFGILAPIVFILLQILQVIFAPIPGQLTGVVSGYIFGAWLGTLYTMIGVTVGSLIIVLLARRCGRPFVEKVVNKKILKKFDYICKDKGILALFLIFLLPALPDDAVCFIAGLTKIRLRTLMLIIVIGRLPGFFILNLVGHGVAVSQTKLAIIILGITIIISLLLYINRKKMEGLMNKIVGRFKRN